MKKYRGKYTNARDCKHAETTENLMVSVEVKETCPQHGKLRHNIVPAEYCQHKCTSYESEDA